MAPTRLSRLQRHVIARVLNAWLRSERPEVAA
jgi:hypothetical protein